MDFIAFIILAFGSYWVFTDVKKHGGSTVTASVWATGFFFIFIIVLPLWLFWGRKEVGGNVITTSIFCKSCGAPCETNAAFCTRCGKSLGQTSTVGSSANKKDDMQKTDISNAAVNRLPFFNDDEQYDHKIDCPVFIVRFTDGDFNTLFDTRNAGVKEWFTKNSKELSSFNFDDGFPGKEGENIALFYESMSSGDFEVFGYCNSNGSYPDRWQDKEDYKEWLDSMSAEA